MMSFLSIPEMSRRRFLTTTLAGVGAVSILRPATATAEDTARTRWALLSDLHIPRDTSENYHGFHPYDNMKRAVGEVLEAKPEGTLITGDLARLEGFAGDYAVLKTLVEPIAQAMPLCLTLGNHDDRENFYNAFKEHPGKQNVSGKHVLVIERPPVRFVLLDTLMFTNKTPGLVGKTQRDWLRDYLRSADKTPTILFFHHTLSDADGSLLDFDRLAYIIAETQVKAIVYGHSHEYDYSERFGIHLINIPAIGYAFGTDQPIGWVEAVFTAAGGDFTLHAIGSDLSKNGQTVSLQWR